MRRTYAGGGTRRGANSYSTLLVNSHDRSQAAGASARTAADRVGAKGRSSAAGPALAAAMLPAHVAVVERLDRLEALEEALARGQRLDAPRGPQPVARGAVAARNAPGGLAVGAAQARPHVRGVREHRRDRLDVGLMTIRNHVRRGVPTAAQRPLEEGGGGAFPGHRVQSPPDRYPA